MEQQEYGVTLLGRQQHMPIMSRQSLGLWFNDYQSSSEEYLKHIEYVPGDNAADWERGNKIHVSEGLPMLL